MNLYIYASNYIIIFLIVHVPLILHWRFELLLQIILIVLIPWFQWILFIHRLHDFFVFTQFLYTHLIQIQLIVSHLLIKHLILFFSDFFIRFLFIIILFIILFLFLRVFQHRLFALVIFHCIIVEVFLWHSIIFYVFLEFRFSVRDWFLWGNCWGSSWPLRSTRGGSGWSRLYRRLGSSSRLCGLWFSCSWFCSTWLWLIDLQSFLQFTYQFLHLKGIVPSSYFSGNLLFIKYIACFFFKYSNACYIGVSGYNFNSFILWWYNFPEFGYKYSTTKGSYFLFILIVGGSYRIASLLGSMF